jgi:molybdopterin-biosynthesis enzyme MoeA-like protein
MCAETLSIASEFLSGQIVDTGAALIARHLAAIRPDLRARSGRVS